MDTRFEEHPALDWAARLACENQAEIKIVDVVPEFSWIERMVLPDDEHMQQVLSDDKHRRLGELAASLQEQGIDVSTKVLSGETSVEIIHEVLRSHHDLVVQVTKGTHSQGAGFFGTTSMRLLRKCPCAVWLVQPDVPPRFGKVLAAIDPKPDDVVRERLNTTIMELGMSIADYEKGEFHVVHAWELFAARVVKSRFNPGEFAEFEQQARSAVAVALDKFLSPYGLDHQSERVHLIRDEIGAGQAISALVAKEQMDLVVMGTIARSGVSGLLMRNTAEHVLDQVECPVLTLKPDSFNSAVTLPEG